MTQDTPPPREYDPELLQDEAARPQIIAELKGQWWQGVIAQLLPSADNPTFGFLEQAHFSENPFFMANQLARPLKVGQRVEFEVAVNFNPKKAAWGFTMARGKVLAEPDLPHWVTLWPIWSNRWIAGAISGYQPTAAQFDDLAAEGFEIRRLRTWQPTLDEARRLQKAQTLIKQLIDAELSDSVLLEQLGIVLAGKAAVWGDVRQLAEGYLRFQAWLRPLSAGPTNRPTVKLKSPKSPKQRSAKPLGALEEHPRAQPLATAPADFAAFLAQGDDFTVYLDENWCPRETEAVGQTAGVMAGVICRGRPDVPGPLPAIDPQDPRATHEALKAFWACPDVMPFIFYRRFADEDPLGVPPYDPLFKAAVKLLLGWLLRPTTPKNLWIYPKATGKPPKVKGEHLQGEDQTAYFRGVLESDPSRRFDPWRLQELRWCHPDMNPLPYATLLADLALEHNEQYLSNGAFPRFNTLSGYLPFSLELVPRLERLAHLDELRDFGDLLAVLAAIGDSAFGRQFLAELQPRFATQPALQQRLLQALHARYSEKTRDLATLRRAFRATTTLLPPIPNDAPWEWQLLSHMTAIQRANHDGDPTGLRQTVAAYQALRQRAKAAHQPLEWLIEADLHLAVHYADQFQFEAALVTAQDALDDPLLDALPSRWRGRLLSAIGQYQALRGECPEAAGYFEAALEYLQDPSVPAADRRRDQEQTEIYRAFNALAGDLDELVAFAQSLLGPIDAATGAQWASDGSIETQYRHHLLARLLVEHEGFAAMETGYLAARDLWDGGHPQHPWPSIWGHRALLLWPSAMDDAALVAVMGRHFRTAIALADQPDHGATMALIGATWATVAACVLRPDNYVDTARRFLAKTQSLPGMQAAVATLTTILQDPQPTRVWDALDCLPFNYR